MSSQHSFQSSNFNSKDIAASYGQVAAATKANYQKAIYVTAAFLGINVFLLDWPMTIIGMIVTTTLAVLSWNYFRAYFEASRDTYTNYAILAMMGMHVLFAIVYLILYVTDWVQLVWGAGAETLICLISGDCSRYSYSEDFITLMRLINIAVYGSIFVYFAGGIRLLLVRKALTFPVKRIAIPAMLLVPILFIHYLLIGLWESPDSSLFGRIILCIPYFMLLHHFYQLKKAADLISTTDTAPFEDGSGKNYGEEELV